MSQISRCAEDEATRKKAALELASSQAAVSPVLGVVAVSPKTLVCGLYKRQHIVKKRNTILAHIRYM